MTNEKFKKFIMLSISFAFAIVSLTICIIYKVKTTDINKPDIFIIEGSLLKNDDVYRCCYMMQRLPNNKNNLEEKIKSFISDSHIPEAYPNTTEDVIIYFMVPSWKLSISFEETIDNNIDSYIESNCILSVKFSGSETEYFYNDKNVEKFIK